MRARQLAGKEDAFTQKPPPDLQAVLRVQLRNLALAERKASALAAQEEAHFLRQERLACLHRQVGHKTILDQPEEHLLWHGWSAATSNCT